MTAPQSTDQRKDLVWQLRAHSTDTAWIRDTLMRSAADEIERLNFIQRDFHNVDDVAEIRRLRDAIYQACSDMGCFCDESPDELPPDEKCPMCKLELALHGSAADVSVTTTTEK